MAVGAQIYFMVVPPCPACMNIFFLCNRSRFHEYPFCLGGFLVFPVVAELLPLLCGDGGQLNVHLSL